MPTNTTDLPAPSSRPPQPRLARVLYAEDVQALQEVMRLILQREGYQITTADDGLAALRRVQDDPAEFDLVITDHHMPGMNGLELVRALRAGLFPGPIMVFSSELDPAVHQEYHRLGVGVILPKPVRPAVLRQTLADLLPRPG